MNFKIALQIADKDSAVDEWKKKYEDMRNDYDIAQKNVERLQQYMADLPTSEDYSKRNHEISFTTKTRKKKFDDTEGWDISVINKSKYLFEMQLGWLKRYL